MLAEILWKGFDSPLPPFFSDCFNCFGLLLSTRVSKVTAMVYHTPETATAGNVRSYVAADVKVSRIVLPTPFGVGPVNVYVVQQHGRTMLVDAGPNDFDAQQSLIRGLESLRITSLDSLLLTHHHFDHSGSAEYIVKRFDSEVLVHPEGRKYLHPSQETEDHQLYATVFRGAGFARRVVSRVARVFEGYTRYGSTVQPEKIRTVNPGYDDTLGGEIVYCPGHTEDSLGLLIGPFFISGDTLWKDKTPNPFFSGGNPFRGLKAFLATLDTLSGMELGTVLPGHGEPIMDHRKYIDFVKLHHAQRARAIMSFLGEDGEKTAAELVYGLFSNRIGNGSSSRSSHAEDYFLALAEVVGNLEIFQEEGRVVREEREDTFFYRLSIRYRQGH